MKPYIVCARPRVVLFGYADSEQDIIGNKKLKDARMLVFWSSGTKGLLGAAKNGPAKGSRVSPASPSITIVEQIEGIIECTAKAAKVFESEPWD